jgi:adenosylmethionine-8-amino-7-oxononanoate aminotransferase
MRNGAPFWTTHVNQVINAIRAKGVLVHPGPSAIQVVPALTFTEGEISELLDGIEAGLTDFAAARESSRARNRSRPAQVSM